MRVELLERAGASGSTIVDAVEFEPGDFEDGVAWPGVRMILGKPGVHATEFTTVPASYVYSTKRGQHWKLEDVTDPLAASGSLMSNGKVVWRGTPPTWIGRNRKVFDAARLHAHLSLSETRGNPARRSKLWMLQTVRVPRTHPDVVAHGTEGAVAVAERRKVTRAAPTKAERTDKNYISFEQFAPDFATREYRALKTPRNAPKDRAVLMISAVVKPAVAHAKVTRSTRRDRGGRGKSTTVVYLGQGFQVVLHVTPKQAATMPTTATLASLAAKYAPSEKPRASVANVRLISYPRARAGAAAAKSKTAVCSKTAKAARRNPRGRAKRGSLVFWV